MDKRHQEETPRPAYLRRAGGLLTLLAVAVLVAGCGQSSGDGGGGVASADGKKTTATTKKTDARQAGIDFARCMREHGVDMPDPTFDDQGNAQIGFEAGPVGGDVQFAPDGEPGFREADKACRHHLQGVLGNGPDGKPDAEMQDKALKFARCMRENGVAGFPDPDFSESGMVRIGGQGLDPSSPTMQAAQKACQSILGPPPGRGSGGASPAPPAGGRS